jgi:Lar family restriction alleviation protein
MAELKPCPFCGGEARRYYGNYDLHGITCSKCPLKLYGYSTKGSATRAWNTRTPKERGD